jgi:CDGSH-type Zn-finger protein
MVFGIPAITEKTILADAQGISVKYGDGRVFEIKSDPAALCRCGRSKKAPFSDCSHMNSGFDGTETAGFETVAEGSEAIKGPSLTLLDNERFCAFARFCDAAGRIWNLIEEGSPEADRKAIEESNLCPAGRFIMLDRAGRVIEDKLPPEISVIEDTKLGISGPLWIKGGIVVESADGGAYEVRMKQALCRCGHSENKPFCNGAHASARFKADYGK